MKRLSILDISLYVILGWLLLSLISSIYSLYKVQSEINKLRIEIEKYKVGYLIYTSRTNNIVKKGKL